MKFVDTQIVFQEIPNEVSLAINISNCPCNCKGCHSSYLFKDIGEELSVLKLKNLIIDNEGITCIAIMGGDAEPQSVNFLFHAIKSEFPNLKTAWYSGRQELSKEIDLINFNYIKLGPYIEEYGGLNEKNTNQRFYQIINNELVDKTSLFWN